MTRVDFYVLQDQDLAAQARFACRLACKALDAGMPVILHTESDEQSVAMDELLWRYPEGRFIPHGRLDQPKDNQTPSPIQIGSATPREREGLLINLSTRLPDFFAGFDRVAEIIVEANRALGRTNYKAYRDRGYPLFHHELEEWEGV